MLLLREVAAVIQEVRGEPGCYNDPPLLRSAVVSSPCPSDDEDRTRCPHPSTRLCPRRLLREEGESHSAHREMPQSKRSVCSSTVCGAVVWRRAVAYRSRLLWSCPRRVPALHHDCCCGRLFPQDANLWGDSSFSLLATSVEQAPQDDRLFVADRFFLESLLHSANRARLKQQPSLRHSVEMTDRGPALVLSKQGRNAQTGHYLHVENIGIVSDQFSQVPEAPENMTAHMMLPRVSFRFN